MRSARLALAALAGLITIGFIGTANADISHTTTLAFDGVNDVVTVGNQASLSPSRVTVEAWIRPRSIANTNSQDRVVSKGTSYELTISTGDTGCASGTQGSVQWRATIDGKDQRICGGQLTLNAWHHIAGTYDGARFDLYVDGTRVATVARTGAMAVNTTPLTLGNRPALDRPFDGLLDEVRIWNRALTQSELQGFSTTPPDPSTTALLAYFRMDEASGQAVLDDSVNSNDGVLGATSATETSDPTHTQNSGNTAPGANAGPDQMISLPTTTAQLFGSVQDDGLPTGSLSIQWSRVSGPGAVTFANPAAAQTSATFSTAGTYVLQLRVSDGELSDTDTMQVTVASAQAISSLEIHPRFLTLRVGATQQFWVTARDGSGRVIRVTPTWTTTRGSITSSGLHTAPTAANSYVVTAKAGGISARAQVDAKGTIYWPTTSWSTATPSTMGMDEALLAQARDYALTGGGSGMIVRGGRVVYSWGNLTTRYDIKSSTKSVGGATALGMAIMDGTIDLTDAAQMHLPDVGLPPASNANTGWLDDITLLHLATHTAGFEKPGGYTQVVFKPGTRWLYTDGGANWLADVLTTVFNADLNTVLFNRAFTPLGIKTTDLTWRSNAYREDTLNGVKRREFGAGIFANVNAMARVGYLYLRRGQWNGQRILPDTFIEQVQQPQDGVRSVPVYDPVNFPTNTAIHYGVLWWTNADSTLPAVPRDTYWSWGLGDMLIVVIPSLDIVAIRTGTALSPTGWHADYGYLDPLFTPIAKSVTKKVSVPSVGGQTQASAADTLDQAGLAISSVTQQSSTTVASGRVISQTPNAGASVVRNTGVRLFVSRGP